MKKFNRNLCQFRIYIHSYEQIVRGFTADEHTVKVRFPELNAALTNLAGERR